MKQKIIIAVVAVVALSIAATFFVKHQKAQAARYEQEQRQKAEAEARVQQDIDLLKVAPEVIHGFHGNQASIIETIHNAFELVGVEWIYPYINQRWTHGASTTLSLEQARAVPDVFLGDEIHGAISSRVIPVDRYESDDTVESVMRRDARSACRDISCILRDPEGSKYSYQYLRENPNLWSEEIRPRLLVLANAASRWDAMAACEALVAGGDRSPYLQVKLTALTNRFSDGNREDVVALLKECGWPAPARWPTLSELPSLTGDKACAESDRLPATALKRIGEVQLDRPQKKTTSEPEDQVKPVSPWWSPADLLHVSESGEALIAAKSRGKSDLELWQVDLNTGDVKPLSFGGPKYANVQAAGVSPDGRTLVTYNQPTVKSSDPPVPAWFTVWDLQSGKAITELPGPRQGRARETIPQWIKFSGNGKRLLIQGASFDIYDTSSWELLWKMPLRLGQPPVFLPLERLADVSRTTALRMKEGTAFVGIERGAVRIWSDVDGLQVQDVNGCPAFSAVAVANHKPIIAAFGYGRLLQWPVESVDAMHKRINIAWGSSHLLALKGEWKFADGGPKRAIFSPDDNWLITIQVADNDLLVWALDGRPIGRITGHQAPVHDMRFADNRLITTSRDTTILVWDWPALKAKILQQQQGTDEEQPVDVPEAAKASSVN